MKPDYETMWCELKIRLNSYFCLIESFNKESHEKSGFKALETQISNIMYEIESKYQPKQYSWSEIITMNPLPKTVCSNIGYNYTYDNTVMTYVYLHLMGNRYPSVEEMKNKWIIVEE